MKKIHHYQLLSYGFFGVVSTLVNIFLYQAFLTVTDFKIANLIAIIGSKIFAYFVNKKFVFRTKSSSIFALIAEMLKFILTRSFTGLIDYFGLIILLEVFMFDEVYAKYLLQIVIVVLNYFFGKKVVFINKDKKV